ncbi:MAG: condensation domain-containing protein [Geodermatophilaceae bacterium]
MPTYAVPAVLMTLPALPRTPNGKVDRAALPAPQLERDQSGARYVPPVTALEQELAKIWMDLLGVDQVGLVDRFDDLGGHSLLALRMLGRIEAQLSTSVPLAGFLATPTLGALADLVESHRGSLTGTPLRRGVGTSPGPLSPVQEDFWFSEQFVTASSMYTVPLRFRVRGRIDADRLAEALSGVVGRHEALRTAYTETAGQVVATVIEPYPVDVSVVDLRQLSAPARDGAAQRSRAEAACAHIDVSTGRLLRAVLIQQSDDEAELVLTAHHIGFDGYSTGVLTTELGRHLSGHAATIEPPMIQGRDYAAWRSGAAPAQRQDSTDFWREELDGADLLLELPADAPRPAVLSFRGCRVTRPLDAELLDDARQLGRRNGASLFATLLAGLDVLVHQLTGRTDFVIGAQTADRMASELRDHIGLCINTLPVRARCDGDPTFGELLVRTRDTVYAALAHQEMSYVDIIRALNVPRSLQHTNLVQVMIAVQNYAVPPVATPDLTLEHLPELDNGTSKVDLTLFVEFTAEGPVLAAEWSADLFTAGTIGSWLDHYVAILSDALSRPGRSIAELGMTSAVRRLRSASLGGVATWEDTAPLHVLLARTAAEHPDQIAVTDGTEQLTYSELLAAAHRLAHRLRGLGVGPESLVGICVDRHPRMVVGLLAILAAGGAYLPLDPDFPADRIDFMLRDSGAVLLLSESHLLAGLPEHRPEVVLLDADGCADQPDTAPDVQVTPDQLAYVLYTSGSTGRPKGWRSRTRRWSTFSWRCSAPRSRLRRQGRGADHAVLRHRRPGTLAAPAGGRPHRGDGPSDRLRRRAARSATRGARGQRPAGHPDDLAAAAGRRMGRAVHAAGVVRRRGAPSRSRRGTRQTGGGALEPLRAHRGDDLDEYPASRRGARPGAVPIGRPIPNTSAWLLDGRLRPVPWGANGELCLGGAGVARGYRHRPGLTADRFVPDPFGPPGSRLYRTGDRARFHDDGTLEFLGRDDDQIKLRGFRIELGEVESVLRSLPGVAAAASAVWGADATDQRLVAYVVPADQATVDPNQLRTAAQRFLPDHMLPSQIELLDALPLTANRKLDRLALPEPDRGVGAIGTLPRDPFEEIVAEVWCEVLGVEQVTVDADFFALGGHSLLATRVVSRLGQRFELPVAVRLVFEAPTVEGQARRIEADLMASLGEGDA